MKILWLTLLASLSLTACHVGRSGSNSVNTVPASTSKTTADTSTTLEKSRDSMLDKNVNVKGQHWSQAPAAASSTATPTVASPDHQPAAPSSAAGTPKGAPKHF